MTPQQIQEFKIKAKALGKSDAQINAFLQQKAKEQTQPKEGQPFSFRQPQEGALFSARKPVEEKSVGGFLKNTLKSGGQFIKDTATGIKDAFIHPVRTVQNIGDPLTGAATIGIEKLMGTNRFENDPQVLKAKAVGNFYKDRYGGTEQIKNTLYNDPVGALSDASTIFALGGGALSKAGTVSKIGTLTKTGKVVSKAGELTNPLNVVGKTVGVASRPFSNALEKSAIAQYSQALAPTTKETKFLTNRITPELLKRGEKSLTLQGLENKAQTNLTKIGQKLDDAESSINPQIQVKTQKVLDDLNKYEEQFYTTNNKGQRIALEPDKIAATRELKSIIQQFDGSASFESFQKAKRIWAETISEAKGYAGKSFTEGSKLKVKDVATDAIRQELAKNFPDLDKLNKEYSFWKNVEKVTSETLKRKTGQAQPLGQTMAQNVGQGAGLIRGTVSDAIFLGSALKNVTKLFQSPGYRMISSTAKYRLAKLISAGKFDEASKLVNTLLNTASFLSRQEESQREPQQ